MFLSGKYLVTDVAVLSQLQKIKLFRLVSGAII